MLLAWMIPMALAGEAAAPAHVAPPVDVSVLPASARVRPPPAGEQTHPVEARLLVRPEAAGRGDTVQVAVHLAQDPEWHTYWRTPGDIGLPTTLTWTLPTGVSAGARHWPVPERFEADGIVSYGYDREVLHVVDLVVAPDAPLGQHPIAVDVEWLVCKTSCIPGKARLEGTIVVAASTEDGETFDAVFGHWEGRRAAASDPAVTAEAFVCADKVVESAPFRTVVALTPAAGATLGPWAGATWPHAIPILGPDAGVDRVRVVEHDGARLVGVDATAYAVPAAVGDVAGALVKLDVTDATGARSVHLEVTTPVPWAKEGTPVASEDPRCRAFDAPSLAAATPAAPEPPPDVPVAVASGPSSLGLLVWNLFLAFVGGLILNVMPCVLPVLTLKLYGLVDQGGVTPAERRAHGLAYTGGVLVSFWVLAAAIVVAKATLGSGVGWGFQFQYPGYVAGLATVVFLFGLSLFGVFEIPALGMGTAHELGAKEGPGGAFFTGMFATLVATPCSAPFLGTATAFAFQAPTIELVAIFSMVGLGLASPFLLVAFVPGAYKVLPRPGAWMDTFKQLLGFTLIGTTVWLVGVLAAQVGEVRTTGFLAFLTVAALGAWIYGHFAGVAASWGRQGVALVAALAVGAVGWWSFVDLDFAESCAPEGELATELDWSRGIPWQDFSEPRIEQLRGSPVFVDFTAEWCVSCKVNERTVLETETVREAMRRAGVVPLKADWTRQDPVIGAWLTRYQRGGVPLYLVIPPSGVEHAIALPEVITPGMVVDAVARATAAP